MTPHALTWKQYRRKRWLLGEFIRAACMHSDGELNKREIEKRIKSGLDIPIMFKDGNHITGLMTLELEKDALFVTTMSGKFKPGWQTGVCDTLIGIAKSQGRNIIRGGGRKGWDRMLGSIGFIKAGKYLELTIDNTGKYNGL